VLDYIPDGFSDAADSIGSFQAEIRLSQRYTATQYNHNLEDLLAEAITPAITKEWVYEGNSEITDEVILLAKSFLEALPPQYQNPDITPEPDGHIMLEWFTSKRQLLTISINPDGRLHWSALIGNDDPRGTTRFLGTMPDLLHHLLTRVVKA